LKKALFAVAVFLLILAAFAQEGMRVVRPPQSTGLRTIKTAPTTIELRGYGRDLLQITEADASALDGGMRAWGQWQVARGCQQSDKKKALELLESALVALRSVSDDRLHTRAQLQEQIMTTYVSVAPGRADELVSSIDIEARPKVLSALLKYYQENGNTGRALQMIYRIGDQAEIPYQTATEIMGTMKSAQAAEFQRLFATSLSSYRSHAGEQRYMEMGSGFPEMITAFWRQLAKDAVREAIDEVLRQTDPSNAKNTSPALFSIASDKGSLVFPSAYQYQLFQFLPILQELDSSAAEQYLKKYNQLAGMLNRYPLGTLSLSMLSQPAASADRPRLGSGVTYSVSRNEPADNPYMADMHRVQKLTAEAESDHAAEAIAKVPSIGTPSLRGAAYNNIAHVTMNDHPATARECVEKLLETGEKLPPFFRLMGMRAAIDVYMHMGDFDDAKSVIEKAMSVANEVYREDANPDDPNKALKAYWSATDGYRALLRQAARISPQWSMTLLNEIRDPEVKVASEAAIAGAWLGVPMGQSIVMIDKKDNLGTMVGGAETE
jgi:hypothetical protein